MRPSRRLIALVLALAAITLLIGLMQADGGAMAGLLWGMLILAGIVDLIVSPAARNFNVAPELREIDYVGTETPFRIGLTAQRGTLPHHLQLRLTHNEKVRAEADTLTVRPYPGSRSTEITYPVLLRERGEGQLSLLSMRFLSRLGLFEILPSWPLDLTIKIVPNVSPVLNGEIQTQMLPLLDGMKDMRLRGDGSDFHQLREFQTGMDPRNIDWKRSARLRSLVARETRAERNHQIILCVDSGHLMAERIGKLHKLDYAINSTLALTWAGALGGDNVGFYSFASRPQQLIPPQPGRKAFIHIQKHSVELEPEHAETNHTLGLTHLNGALNRRSLIVIFSDFVDSVTAELLIENLAVISRQHLVLYVVLRDPRIESLIHPETISMENVSQAVSARQMMRERQSVLDRLQRLGILCLDTVPEALTPALVSRYIDIKSQELI